MRVVKRRGLSLLEAVMTLVFLSGATLTIVGLFHTGLRHQAQADDRVLAVTLAQRQLEALRHQARIITGFEELANYDGSYQPDATLPRFEVAITTRDARLISPCSSFGQANQPALSEPTRILTDTARWCWVGVRWGGGQSLRVSGLVSQPISLLNNPPRVEVAITEGDPSSLAHDAELKLQATLVDNRGRSIEGARFNFYIKPKTANATLKRHRDGRKATLQNHLTPPTFPSDALAHPPGTAYDTGNTVVTASGRYFGRKIWGNSAAIHLP